MKKILIISARSYGDAVIISYFVKLLSKEYDITVFTKAEFKDIYADVKTDIVYSKFPMGTNSTINIIHLLLQIFKLRKNDYDYAIDLIGDFRERLILSVIRPRHLLSIERESGHPFNCLIRKGLNFLVEPIFISKNMLNIYDQFNYVIKRFVNGKKCENKIISKSKIIGIHPFASQECRMWTWEKWNSLVEELIKSDYEVVVFGSPNQKSIIEKNIKMRDGLQVFCSSLKDFFYMLKKCKFIICLDSFAYHAAYCESIPSVMLNGGNQYKIWENPLSIVVHQEKECAYWPCYNNPKCNDYRCITSIEGDMVIKSIKILMERIECE